MSATARGNGWRGFDSLDPERVEGGWRYDCEAQGHGCSDRDITVTRKWTTVGRKKRGWVVCYGHDGDLAKPDLDVVLVLCPAHAAPPDPDPLMAEYAAPRAADANLCGVRTTSGGRCVSPRGHSGVHGQVGLR